MLPVEICLTPDVSAAKASLGVEAWIVASNAVEGNLRNDRPSTAANVSWTGKYPRSTGTERVYRATAIEDRHIASKCSS
jgi:hypothetical protein